MTDRETTRVHLMRHGEVAPEWRRRIYGGIEVPLSERGREQARARSATFAGVPLAAVVSSGLERAELGASLLRAGRGLARRDEPALVELDRGEWAGLRFDELEARDPGAWERWIADPQRRRPPGGESLDDLCARVVPCIDALAREHAGGAIAVVAHSWVCRIVVCEALALPSGHAVQLDLPTGGLAVVDWPADGGGDEPEELRPRARPTLAGFGLDEVLDGEVRWFRGPHRG